MTEMTKPRGIDALPGDLMMWVLIVSELLVFGAGLVAFMGVRLTDPIGFAEAQTFLDASSAGINTVILVTSGWLAALAVVAAARSNTLRCRLLLLAASVLGAVFLVIKWQEYASKSAQGIDFETHPFFLFYYMLTGFHAMHVVAGLVILGLVGWRPAHRSVEVGAAFWHMVDLVWVLLFPIIYLL